MNRLQAFLREPLSNKRLTFRHLYWHIKMRLYYRFMFKSVGRKSVIYRPMLICNADCIEIADGVRIWDGVRLEAVRDPYGRTPRLTIGSGTGIEQGVHIVCHNRVAIGSDVSITARCAIADITHPFDRNLDERIGSQILDEDSYVEIGDGAFIGYGSVILPNVRIGKRAVIGANSVVTRDVPDYAVAAGIPARVLRIYADEAARRAANDILKTMAHGDAMPSASNKGDLDG